MLTFWNNTCLVFFLILCLTVIGCEREEEETQQVEPTPTQQLEKFSMQHREAGLLKWALVGDVSTMVGDSPQERGNKVIIQNPKVEIFEEGEVSLTLTAKTGKFFSTGPEKENLFLYGEVVGVNENGTLYTEELQWRNKDGTLYSPTEVKIVRGDSTWYGTEMVANPNLETVTMSKNRFKLYPKDEEINE